MNDLMFPRDVALVIIDVQKGFRDPFWGARNNPNAEANISRILTAWRETRRPVYHIQHLSRVPGIPLSRGAPGVEFMEEAKPLPSEPVIQKEVNSAFIGTDLEIQLRGKGIKTLIFSGLTTDHYVSTSVRMAANLGFTCFVVSDATATFDRSGPGREKYRAEDVHRMNLASLHDEFGTVLDTEELLQKL